jgi:hypothetical protein
MVRVDTRDPSTVTDGYWVKAYAPDIRSLADTSEFVGKWMVFVYEQELSEVWNQFGKQLRAEGSE